MSPSKKRFLKVAFLLWIITVPARAETDRANLRAELEKNIKEFTQVDENLYRGCQPDEKGLALLKQFGIKSIISFRHEKKYIEWELKQVNGMGMYFGSFPWKIWRHPREGLLTEFLNLVRQKDKGPFFMHCQRGVERTGVVNALYYYYVMRLPYEEAYDKAMTGHNRLWYYRPFTRLRYRQFIKEIGRPQATNKL